MTIWEYKTVIECDSTGRFTGVALPEEKLNKLGSTGWELVTVITNGDGSEYVFKRPKPAKVEGQLTNEQRQMLIGHVRAALEAIRGAPRGGDGG
jgi:hypothetical protein